MYGWMAWAQHISSFVIRRAAGDSCRMLLRPSRHMWQRHSLSGLPAPLILSSSSSHWWRVGDGPWPLQIGATKGPEWGTLTAPCPTWFLESWSPCQHWWGVPNLAPHKWGKLKKGVTALLGCPPHSQKGDPPRHTLQRMVQGNSLPSSPDRGGPDSDGYSMVSEAQSTHHHRRKWWEEKQLAPAYLDMPIVNQLTQMQMSHTPCAGLMCRVR